MSKPPTTVPQTCIEVRLEILRCHCKIREVRRRKCSLARLGKFDRQLYDDSPCFPVIRHTDPFFGCRRELPTTIDFSAPLLMKEVALPFCCLCVCFCFLVIIGFSRLACLFCFGASVLLRSSFVVVCVCVCACVCGGGLFFSPAKQHWPSVRLFAAHVRPKQTNTTPPPTFRVECSLFGSNLCAPQRLVLCCLPGLAPQLQSRDPLV